MLTKQQICKLNDVEPTENVLKAMEEWGKQEHQKGCEYQSGWDGKFFVVVLAIIFTCMFIDVYINLS